MSINRFCNFINTHRFCCQSHLNNKAKRIKNIKQIDYPQSSVKFLKVIFLAFPPIWNDSALMFKLFKHLWTHVVSVLWKSLSHVWYFATPWTVGHQAPLSMEFSRQEYWSGLPFPFPGIWTHNILHWSTWSNQPRCSYTLLTNEIFCLDTSEAGFEVNPS